MIPDVKEVIDDAPSAGTLSRVQQFVGFYIRNMGLEVVRLHGKDAYDESWQRKHFDIHHFTNGHNVGLKSVNGIVLSDDDFTKRFITSPEDDRRILADAFMPEGAAIYGRKSAPRSKRVFYCPTLTETKTWKDLKGDHLYQLRVGLQDMAPPSIHPDTKEILQWAGPLWHGMLAPIDAERLITAVNLKATAALIALSWPKHGRRELRLAFSRFMLETIALDEDVVTSVLRLACAVGGSDKKGVEHVDRAVRHTRVALDNNKKAIGAGHIRNTLPDGAALLRRLREWFGKTSEIEESIERLNDRFAIVSVGNKVVVMDNLPDGSIRKLWPFDEFKKLLAKEHVTVKSKTPTGKPTENRIPLAGFWIQHRNGRRYESLVYDMPGSAERCGPDDYNGYLGFTVKPVQGDWSKNQDHIRKIICGGVDAHYDWLFNWMAALVQSPGQHAFAAVVLRGGEGVGKGHFAHQMLGGLFHPQQYLHIIGAGMLTGQFNEHLSGKSLVFADESTWGGDPKAADKLKGMVTESTVPIERKFLPLVEEPSALHIIIASNNEWPVAIPRDDRRFVVFDVADTQRQIDSYFTPLRDELSSGGLAAMLFDLLQHKVNESDLRHPPTTKAKCEVIAQSLKPIERWWYEKLIKGTMTIAVVNKSDYSISYKEMWPESISKETLHEDYMAFLDKHRESRGRRSTETELGMFLKKVAPIQSGSRRSLLPEDARKRTWELPSLKECREQWAGEHGWEWRDEEG